MFARQRGATTRQPPSRARHMRRLMAAEAARRSARVVRRASAGQTLIIFALTFTVLIGFMGLAIDSIRVYDLYARMQRAAEAGALAGVIYMPNNYTTDIPISPNNNAICQAEVLVNQNNFGPTACTSSANTPAMNCATPSAQEVAVCPVPNEPYQLQVSITEPINVLFLSALNVGPLTITASAIAAYLPPVNIASDPTGTGSTGSWGSFGECGKSGSSASAACTGTSSVRNWSGNINGPGELKEQGDPLVTCAEGANGPAGIDLNAATMTSATQYTTYTGLPTNHPQTDGLNPGDVPSNCGNTDTQGAFTGPDYTGSGALQRVGYSFLVYIPTVAQGGSGINQSLWIWNAPFSPETPKNCNGRTGGQSTASYDIFYEYNCKGSGGSNYPYYPGLSNLCGASSVANSINPYTCLDPKLYFTVSYSIYRMANLTDITGTLQATYTALPYAGQQSCGNGQYEAVGGSTVAAFNSLLPNSTCVSSPCVANWCPLQDQIGDLAGVPTCTGVAADPCDLLPGNYYRIMVVASDYGDPTNQHLGWGGHSYSLKLCPSGTTTQSNVQKCTTGGTLGGWNASDAVFIFPGGGGSNPQITEYPLGVIDPSFAGRTLDVQLYDPGDLNGNNGAATGLTLYAVAPPTAAADPCNPTAQQLSTAGYTASNFHFPTDERAYTADNTIVLNTLPAMEPANSGDLIYNGLWVDEQIKVPSTYNSSATWTLCAEAPQTNDADVLAIGVFALGQSPVHLVQ